MKWKNLSALALLSFSQAIFADCPAGQPRLFEPLSEVRFQDPQSGAYLTVPGEIFLQQGSRAVAVNPAQYRYAEVRIAKGLPIDEAKLAGILSFAQLVYLDKKTKGHSNKVAQKTISAVG